MKILDLYIIKKYIGTFFVMLGLFIPIGIMVDIAEKIDKFRENEVPNDKIIDYYLDFIWYFGNQLYPVFIFLAVILVGKIDFPAPNKKIEKTIPNENFKTIK